MLKTILIREIQEYLKSNKLWISLVVITALFCITTVSYLFDYQEWLEQYSIAPERNDGDGTKQIYKPPEVFTLFAKSQEVRTFDSVTLSMFDIMNGSNSKGYWGDKQLSGILEAAYSNIDISYLVKVFLSLFVIFFAYDSVSGEKSQGTLRLMLSNAIPRYNILLGKIIVGMSMICLLLAIPMAIVTLILIFHLIRLDKLNRLWAMICCYNAY